MTDGRTALGPEDWAEAALRLLASSGGRAPGVEPLAARLGVTKGSFYWHFRDRRALLEAMVALWEERATRAIVREVESGGGGAEQRLERLLARVAPARPNRLESAMRAFAQSHAWAAAAMQRVDAEREAYLARLLGEAGLDVDTARVRAALLHRALIGEWTLGATRRQPPDAAWRSAVALFTR